MKKKGRDFEALDLYGKKICSKDFRGKNLYLVFNRGFF